MERRERRYTYNNAGEKAGSRGRGAHLAWLETAKGRATGWRWDWMIAPNGTETDGDAVLLCVHAGRREPREKKRGRKKKHGKHPAAPQGDGTAKDVWLGPRDGPRGLGTRRHKSEGRGREGSDPC